MKQKHSDQFRRIYNSFTEEECQLSSEKAAKHILSAVAFKESSKVSYELTKSVLLPPIGYYYSLFHMSVALCWLNPTIERSKLEKLRHSTLQKLIVDNYVRKGILSESYTNLMNELKEEREWLNYSFGEFQYCFFETNENNIKLINLEFDKCFIVIDEICDLLSHKFDIKQWIKLYIGDAKGDDFVQTYLSDFEQDLVLDYIVQIGYST